MTLATKKNGPASVAPDPDRGSNLPVQEKAMNAHSFSTTTAIPATAPIAALIEAHKAACEVSDAAWMAVSTIEEANPIEPARVHVSTMIHWVKGQRREDPIYAYSIDELDRQQEEELRGYAARFGTHEPSMTRFAGEVEARYAAYRRELRLSEAAKKQAADACGLTKATKAGRAASNRVEAALDAIMEFPFTTAEEVRLAAAHLCRWRLENREGVDDEELIIFVKLLGGVLK